MLELTQDNYHSIAANLEYMSRSQYTGFVYECEAKEMVKLTGDWVDVATTAQEVGQYVHSWNAGKQKEFQENHPNMFTKANTLKADYLVANTMIDCLQNDPFAMSYLEGEKERILTAEMYGAPWKIMMNVHSIPSRRMVDLMTTRSIIGKVWDEAVHGYVSFIELAKAPIKAAIYAEVERLAMGRAAEDWSEFMVVAVSKEKYPDKAVFNMTNPTRIAAELATFEANMPRIIALKAGLEAPRRCEKCNYCRSTKVLSQVIQYSVG